MHCFIFLTALCFAICLACGVEQNTETTYTATLTNLTSRYLVQDNVFDSERCSISHIPNSEFYVAFWTNYDSYYRNIKSGLYKNNGQLLISFDDDVDPTFGYSAIESYGIRTTQCPTMKNNVSLTAITFYRKTDNEKHTRVYLKLLFSFYNDSTGRSDNGGGGGGSSSTSNTNTNSNTGIYTSTVIEEDMLEMELNKEEILTTNDDLTDLTYYFSDELIAVNEMDQSVSSQAFPDVACIEHGSGSTVNGDESIETVGLMIAWEHYSTAYSHRVYARYIMISQMESDFIGNDTDTYASTTTGTPIANKNKTNGNGNSEETIIEFLDQEYVITMSNKFVVGNSSNDTSSTSSSSGSQQETTPYVSGRYIKNSTKKNGKNDSRIVEEFLITRTITNDKGYDIISSVYQIDSNVMNMTGYTPKCIQDDFSIARLTSKNHSRHNYVPFSSGSLGTNCWNQISLSIGGYVAFYSYFDSATENNLLYLSYIYDSNGNFDVNKAILVGTVGNYGYQGEIIELADDYNNTKLSNNNDNETNIFVLFGNYDENNQKSTVLGKLYHVRQKHDNSVIFREIGITNGSAATDNTSSLITFDSGNHYYWYKCAASNNRDTETSNNSDIMIGWTDSSYDMNGKFVNIDIKSHGNGNNSGNHNQYSTNVPRTSNGFYTTRGHESKHHDDDNLDNTSIVLIVVVLSLSLMCMTCVCVFGWLVYKGKVNVQIGNGQMVSERLLDNGNNVQLTSEEIERGRNFSAVM